MRSTLMRRKTKQAYLEALTLGSVAGMRSFAAPAVANLQRHTRRGEAATGFAARAVKLFPLVAGFEMVADKLPILPNRTKLPPLLGRVVMGAIAVASILPKGRHTNLERAVGIALGTAAALAASHVMSLARKTATERFGVPNFIAGLAEDALVFGLSKRLVER